MDTEHERAQDGAIPHGGEPVRTPPRFMIRLFWSLHRGLYSLSRGRFGLSRPRLGKRFGMMRIETLGRRSGQPRKVIVGYYEDGPNLVTLAMNGWAEAHPAWWLNVQARPETTVTLVDGPRRVHAREAVGQERTRLWARFRDFPGWGEDLDSLAASRSRVTPVIVFEPSGPEGGGSA